MLTTFTIDVDDGVLPVTSDSTTTVSATAVNNAATINVPAPNHNQAINDSQTRAIFGGVTFSDPDNSAEPASVTVTLSVAANGQFTAASTSAGWTVDVAAGTYTFSGTRSAVQAALQALVFAPTAHQVVPGDTVTTGFTISLTDGSPPAVTDSTTNIVVTATNSAPVLSGANDLTSVTKNQSPISGTAVSDLIAGHTTDPDFGQTEGIAVTAVLNTNGTWEYSTDSGGHWTAIGPVSTTSALLLTGDATTFVRFRPNSTFSGAVASGITFRAWDGFTGAAATKVNPGAGGSATAFSTASASSSILVNDAPTLSGANDLTSINENPTTNGGTLVSALISGRTSDANGNSVGIAVTAVDNTNGTWEYTTDAGAHWTAFGSPSTTSRPTVGRRCEHAGSIRTRHELPRQSVAGNHVSGLGSNLGNGWRHGRRHN